MNPKQLISNTAEVLKKIATKANKTRTMGAKDRYALNKFKAAVDYYSGMGDSGSLFSMEYILKTFKITRQTMTDWRKQGFPASEKTMVHSDDVLTWLRQKWLEFREDYKVGGRSDINNKFVQIRIRKTRAEAIRAELLLAEETKRLVDRGMIIRQIRAHISMVSRLMQDLPKRLARHIPAKNRKAFIDESDREIRDLLKTFSEWKEEE